MIRAAAPDAEECIAYGMPAYKNAGRALIYFGAAKNHIALYGGIAGVMAEQAAALASFDTSKGTIRFTPERPLPASLVKALVKGRMAEIDGKA